MDDRERQLLEFGVKPTAVRMLVWEKASVQRDPFSLSDMEEWLPDMDRSSIFRTLRLLADRHLLHEIDDGSGQQKYCVRRSGSLQGLDHIHFTCLRCGQTYCFEDYQIPPVSLPEGFLAEDVEYIVKGVCRNCGQGLRRQSKY